MNSHSRFGQQKPSRFLLFSFVSASCIIDGITMLQKGIFTISIDYESAWGYADHDLSNTDKERIRGEAAITRRLIELFEKYNVPATWAIVGHLFERGCTWDNDTPHPEYPRPIHKDEKRDWFAEHPPKNEYTDPLWFDVDNLVSDIARSPVGHELASHGYAHIMYGEDTTNREAVMADLANLGRVNRIHDVPFTSFVFPRNIEGYHRMIKVNGFTAYRGVSPKWNDRHTGSKRRLTNLLDYYLPSAVTFVPKVTIHGLINIPDSMLLLGRNGPRKLILPSVMVRKAKKGLKKAARRKEVFHLWFHPSNFSYDTETQFRIFEKILARAGTLRDKGMLDIKTLNAIGTTNV